MTITRSKPLVNLINRKDRLQFTETQKIDQQSSGTKFHGLVGNMVWVNTAADRTDTPAFIDDFAANRGNRMNTEVYRSILLDQIQPNTSKLIR